MLNNLFNGNSNIQDEKRKFQAETERAKKEAELREKEERNLELQSLLKSFLIAQEMEKEKEVIKREQIFIHDNQFQFTSEGFLYNYLIVSNQDAGKKIKVNVLGLNYEITLNEGINQISFLQDSVLSSDLPLNVIVIRSNYKLV